MENPEELEEEGFRTEFTFEGRKYIADIKYPFPLNSEERALYKVEDGEFLVHLFDEIGSRTFKISVGNLLFSEEWPHEWVTDSPSLLIEWEFVQVIGNLIDSKLA